MFTAKTLIEVTGLKPALYRQMRTLGLIKATKEAGGSGHADEYDEISICQTLLFLKMKDSGMKRAEASQLAFYPATRKIFEAAVKEWIAKSLHRSELRRKDARFALVNALSRRDLASLEAELTFPDFHLIFWDADGVALARGETELVKLYREKLHRNDYQAFNLSSIIRDVIIGLLRLGEDPFGLLKLAESKMHENT